MENEVRITVKLPADLLADVKAKAEKTNTTVSALVRQFLLAYVKHNNELTCDTNNSIYSYHENAKKKRELKEAIKAAREDFRDKRADALVLRDKLTKESAEIAQIVWHAKVSEYNDFCQTDKKE